MITREELLKSPHYWFEHQQNELFRQVVSYMKKNNMTKTDLARQLKCTKGYVSQILNGNFNYTLKKHTELCLAIGKVPVIQYVSIEKIISDDTLKTARLNAKKRTHPTVEVIQKKHKAVSHRNVKSPK